jgi:hypothetical protein
LSLRVGESSLGISNNTIQPLWRTWRPQVLDEVRDYAAQPADEAVEREAASAVRAAEAGLFTEAGIRLGRCVEAAI